MSPDCPYAKTCRAKHHLLYQSQHIHRFGLHIPTATSEWKDVQASVQQVVKRLRGGTLEEAQVNLERQGIEYLHGEATFISPNDLCQTDHYRDWLRGYSAAD